MNEIQPWDRVMSPEEDVVDVEFETIAAQNTPAKGINSATVGTGSRADQVDKNQLAVFGKKSDQSNTKSLPLPIFTLIAAVCSVGAFYVAGGHILFDPSSSEPQTQPTVIGSSTVEERTLKIENISSNTVERSSLKVLTIRATISNYDSVTKTIPTIIVRLGDDPATGRMFRINRGESLAPGERLVFTNSLPLGNAPEAQPTLSFAE